MSDHSAVPSKTASDVVRSLAAHELRKYVKKFKLCRTSNLMKLLLMVLCFSSFLLVNQVDMVSEFQDPFTVRLCVGSCVLPSVFRVSNMFFIDLSVPILDLLIIVFILVNISVANIIIICILSESVLNGEIDLILKITVGVMLLSITVCLIEPVLFFTNTKLTKRPERWSSLIHRHFAFET